MGKTLHTSTNFRFTGKPAEQSTPGLDIPKLDQAVWFYYVSGLSSLTHKTYKAAKCKYSFSIQPLPTTENIVCYFVACLRQESLAHSIIRTYLLEVCQFEITSGFPNPHIDCRPYLCQVLKGVKVQAGTTDKTPRLRLPITPSILMKLREVWLQGISFNNTMLLAAAATTTFFSFCCSGKTTVPGEAMYDPEVHLSYSDLAVDDTLAPQAISIKIKHPRQTSAGEVTK